MHIEALAGAKVYRTGYNFIGICPVKVNDYL